MHLFSFTQCGLFFPLPILLGFNFFFFILDSKQKSKFVFRMQGIPPDDFPDDEREVAPE